MDDVEALGAVSRHETLGVSVAALVTDIWRLITVRSVSHVVGVQVLVNLQRVNYS